MSVNITVIVFSNTTKSQFLNKSVKGPGFTEKPFGH